MEGFREDVMVVVVLVVAKALRLNPAPSNSTSIILEIFIRVLNSVVVRWTPSG
jgi:hypothetical protein